MTLTRPVTRYAKSGQINIAYQVVGNGPIDLVFVPGWISHLELNWEVPKYVAFMERLSSFCRVILFDKRGTGMSDRDVGNSTLEDRMDDLRAVVDAVGSKRCWVLGYSEGGALAMLFAASYPERVAGLTLFGTLACGHAAEDYPEGKRQAELFSWAFEYVKDRWGEGGTLEYIAPSLSGSERSVQFMGRTERFALSPRAASDMLRWVSELDARPVAESLRVPALVLHREGDRMVNVESGRWLGRHIPHARYVEMPGDNHLPWDGDSDFVLREIRQLMVGEHHEDTADDRVLATVLFTDIVASTERAVQLGDRGWRKLLEEHHAAVRAELARHRGKEIDTAGDGFFAAFEGPARAIRCATAIRDAVKPLGIEVRAGVHTGECERHGEKLAGIAVHTGARVLSCAGPSEVWVSGTVRDLVAGSGLNFEDRGTRALKGIPGEWRLYAVA